MDKFKQHSVYDIATVCRHIDFSPLYSILKHNYKGNDIPNIIMQLVHMYQLEDDITGYERVLRKIQMLLEDCDSHKEQLLLSMIPTPKNVPDHMVKEVFRMATGFIKHNSYENDIIFRNMFDNKNTNEIMGNNTSSTKQNLLCDMDRSDFKSLSESFSFRGFPQNEVSTFRSYVKNIDSSRLQLSNANSVLDKNNKHQTFYQQYLLNKKYYVPARINSANKSHFCYSSQTIYQDIYSMKTYKNDDLITDLNQDEISQQFNDIKYESKKYNDINVLDEDKKSDVLEITINIDQSATVKQLIKDNIHRMDVCWDEDQNIFVEADDLLATVRHNLKTSLNNFLKRAQEGTSVELLKFSCIRPYPQVDRSQSICFTPKERKPVTQNKVLEKNFIPRFSNNINKNCLVLEEQNADESVRKNPNLLDERKKKQETFISFTESQMKCKSQEFDEVIETQPPLFQNNLNHTLQRKAKAESKAITNDTGGSIYKYKMVGSRSSNVNSENNFQTHSVSELTAFKKQYYDTLLSVRRAKVAVTNSLESSSDCLTDYNDTYHSNYVHQYQDLFQQERHFTMRPQFSMCPIALPGLSNMHGNQYSWTRSDCKYFLLKQLKLQHQTSPLYARSPDWTHRYIGSLYSHPLISNGSGQAKQYVRRKTLEDVIGKLKKIERNNANN